MLTGELARLREQGSAQVDALEVARDQIERSIALVELVRPPAPPVEKTPASDDPHLMAWMKKADHEHELRLVEHQDMRELKKEEISLLREKTQAELRLESEHKERMDKFYTDAGPKVIAIIERVATWWMGQGQATVAVVAPAAQAAYPDAAPVTPSVQPPPGIAVAQCSCGAMVPYVQGVQNVATCPNCYTPYKVTPDAQGQEAEQPPAEQEPSYAGD